MLHLKHFDSEIEKLKQFIPLGFERRVGGSKAEDNWRRLCGWNYPKLRRGKSWDHWRHVRMASNPSGMTKGRPRKYFREPFCFSHHDDLKKKTEKKKRRGLRM